MPSQRINHILAQCDDLIHASQQLGSYNIKLCNSILSWSSMLYEQSKKVTFCPENNLKTSNVTMMKGFCDKILHLILIKGLKFLCVAYIQFIRQLVYQSMKIDNTVFTQSVRCYKILVLLPQIRNSSGSYFKLNKPVFFLFK